MALPSRAVLASSVVLFCLAPSPSPAQINLAAIPQPMLSLTYFVQHHRFVQMNAVHRPPIVFLGDSITTGWGGPGQAIYPYRFGELVFQAFFRPAGALNFGIPGMGTEHLLWQIQNGLFRVHKPKVVVLMIGTNNLQRNTPMEIAQGIGLVVWNIRALSPGTRILLLGLLPAGDGPRQGRLNIAAINRFLATLADGQSVFFLNMGGLFVHPSGRVNRALLFDGFHPTFLGYLVWAQVMARPLGYLLALP
jgi:lysophospholipase L1-like esterase